MSHLRQCGLFVLRIFATGVPPNCGGPGIPHRNIPSERLPSGALKTTGARLSGKIAGSGGKLPVVSSKARVSWRMACWFVVTPYRVQISAP
jgi:hypothetical protein